MHSQVCKSFALVRIMPLTQDAQILIPETCEYVTLQGRKRLFADVISLRILQ